MFRDQPHENHNDIPKNYDTITKLQQQQQQQQPHQHCSLLHQYHNSHNTSSAQFITEQRPPAAARPPPPQKNNIRGPIIVGKNLTSSNSSRYYSGKSDRSDRDNFNTAKSVGEDVDKHDDKESLGEDPDSNGNGDAHLQESYKTIEALRRKKRGYPTLSEVKAMPREWHEFDTNSLLVHCGPHGEHDANEERLIREIMTVDEIEYFEAVHKLKEIEAIAIGQKSFFRQLGLLPYRAGIFSI